MQVQAVTTLEIHQGTRTYANLIPYIYNFTQLYKVNTQSHNYKIYIFINLHLDLFLTEKVCRHIPCYYGKNSEQGRCPQEWLSPMPWRRHRKYVEKCLGENWWFIINFSTHWRCSPPHIRKKLKKKMVEKQIKKWTSPRNVSSWATKIASTLY